MDKVQIGENAGIVWRTLESKGSLSFEELQAETKLDQLQLFAAIAGLLAKTKSVSIRRTPLRPSNSIMKVIIKACL